MNITATIKNSYGRHEATVATEGTQKSVSIAGKPEGYGSSVNGGELLFLALATCYGNDVYREAARRGMTIESVEVTVSGQFAAKASRRPVLHTPCRCRRRAYRKKSSGPLSATWTR